VAKKVMIIEDCNAMNFLISTVLKKDFAITSAKNSMDAMHLLQSDVNRDLIILNISDLQSDNFELLEHMSTSSVLNDIQKVVISDSDDEHLKTKATELGASLFFTKPFDPVHLSDRVRDLIKLNESSFAKKRKFSINMNIF
jgi:PleD family two-component response regulator